MLSGARCWRCPCRYREPVVLFYFHEMDVAAAARTMGLPKGNPEGRLSRARTLLRHSDSESGRGAAQKEVFKLETGKEAAR